ncbi:hypothetical protein AMTRI_Chr07g76940 [Amborella trichopoda]
MELVERAERPLKLVEVGLNSCRNAAVSSEFGVARERKKEGENQTRKAAVSCEFGVARERKKEGENNREKKMKRWSDPLRVFGPDLFLLILQRLDAHSVARSLLVSRGWCRVASSDTLWAKKTRILRDDLCDHAWEFRFKKTAPPYWLNLDPSWRCTGPPMHRYFHRDGTQTADPLDGVWGGHESTYCIVTSFVDDEKIREHYVRINRWPRMSVLRKEDWSWELANQLYWYASVPDANKEGGTGPMFLVR